MIRKMRTSRFKRALHERLLAEKKRAKRRAYLAHIRLRRNQGVFVSTICLWGGNVCAGRA